MSWKDWVPLYNAYDDFSNGRYGEGLLDVAGTAGGFALGGPVGGYFGSAALGGIAGGALGGALAGGMAPGITEDVKRKFDQVYADKAAGYDAIRGEVDRLKGERKAQKDYAYQLADSKFEPTRKAISAIYGDPSGWKL